MVEGPPTGIGSGDLYIPLNYRLQEIEKRLDSLERLFRLLIIVLSADLVTRIPDIITLLSGVLR